MNRGNINIIIDGDEMMDDVMPYERRGREGGRGRSDAHSMYVWIGIGGYSGTCRRYVGDHGGDGLLRGPDQTDHTRIRKGVQ